MHCEAVEDIAIIERRVVEHGPRLARQLDRIYGNDELAGRALAIIRQRASDRSSGLRALDATREATPDWFVSPDMVGYSTYVDRFGGTVAGVGNHIDHLATLGVRYLHLLALLKARAGDSDGGFAVADYLSVEPCLGTMDDVEALASRLASSRSARSAR